MLEPVSRTSLPDAVYGQLFDAIVAGDYSPGAALPSERKLAEALKVSRPAVREALKRLSQAGLVRIRQGDATTVRDYRVTGGLHLLPGLLVDRSGTPDLGVAAGLVEVRAAVGPQIAASCARHAGPADRSRIHAAVAAVAAIPAADLHGRQRAAHEMWEAIVDGTGNVVYRLLFNTLAAAYLPALEALGEVMRSEVDDIDGMRALAERIAAGDRDGTRDAAAALLSHATESATTVLEQLRRAADAPIEDEEQSR